jgi:serine protease Do
VDTTQEVNFMRLRFLMVGLLGSVLAVPAVQAQTRSGIQEGPRVQRPGSGRISMIGVRLGDVTAEEANTLKLSRAEGAVVESVNPNSPASTAGLREKDVIVQFDGERVRSASHLSRLVADTPAGREVMLSVMRDGKRTDLRITPAAGERGWFDPRYGDMIDSAQISEQVENAIRGSLPEVMEGMREGLSSPNRARLGVTVQPVSAELAAYFGVKSGVLVASVAPDSAAAKAGLKAGDVITAVNGKPIATPRDLVTSLPAAGEPQDVSLSVVREKKEMRLKATLARATTSRPSKGQRVSGKATGYR